MVNNNGLIGDTLNIVFLDTLQASVINFDAYFIQNNISVNETDKKENQFSVYPNPVSDFVTIQTTGNLNSGLLLEIKDLSGRTVRTEKMNMTNGKYQLSVQSLPSSMYIISISGAGNFPDQIRFVKMN